MLGIFLDITEGIRENDAIALTMLACQSGRTFVEVGTWKGHSASIIGKIAKGKGARLFCVDHWKGNEGTRNIKEKNIYQLFEFNMKFMNLWDAITPMKMDSLTASQKFEDKSIDFLFIDADHRYEYFKKDLEAWFPKVKGIICGHDCEGKYSEMTNKQQDDIKSNLEKDYIVDLCHPGIVKGLFDFFNDDYSIFTGSKIWFKRI